MKTKSGKIRLPEVLGDYKNISKHGSGSYARVYSGCHKDTNMSVAIKVSSLEDDEQAKYITEKEIEIMRLLDHPFIAPIYDVIDYMGSQCIVMEYVDGVNLRDYVNTYRCISDSMVRRIILQMASILFYLHNELHIVHRDIKAENILLDDVLNIRLIDFGMSKIFDKGLTTKCGSPNYVAPEILKGEEYQEPVDIWSFGVLLFAIKTLELPFVEKTDNKLRELIIDTEPTYPSHINSDLLDLIKKMLIKDPKQRITLNGIVSHPFITTNEKNEICRYDSSFLDGMRLKGNGFQIITNPDVINQLRNFHFKFDESEIVNGLMNNSLGGIVSIYRGFFRELITKLMANTDEEFLKPEKRPLFLNNGFDLSKVKEKSKLTDPSIKLHCLMDCTAISKSSRIRKTPSKVKKQYIGSVINTGKTPNIVIPSLQNARFEDQFNPKKDKRI